MAGLRAAGADVTYDQTTDLARFGRDRRAPIDAPDAVLVVGPAAADDRPGARRLASVTDPSVPERSWVSVWLEPGPKQPPASG
jgi:hypothetical protein